MPPHVETTNRYAVAYSKASKKIKDHVLDEVVSVTGWSHDIARRRLPAEADRAETTQATCAEAFLGTQHGLHLGGASVVQYDKCLAASIPLQFDGLDRPGELIDS